MQMISLDNVSYIYRGQKVYPIENFSLEIKKGEFVVLKGTNGSGKSTLAKLIAGVIKPRKGLITINDINTKSRKDFLDLRKEVSIIFQHPEHNLLFDKVYDDLAFGLTNIKIPKDQHKEIITSALKKVGMSGYEQHSTYDLSGGQKQRIAIAGILAMGCPIIVADEPTSMLDTQGKEEIYNLLWELNKQGHTIILSTNIQSETRTSPPQCLNFARDTPSDTNDNSCYTKKGRVISL